jgi:hypothetical protein
VWKSFVIGVAVFWVVTGAIGAWMMNDDRVDLAMVAGGPMSVWHAYRQADS